MKKRRDRKEKEKEIAADIGEVIGREAAEVAWKKAREKRLLRDQKQERDRKQAERELNFIAAVDKIIVWSKTLEEVTDERSTS